MSEKAEQLKAELVGSLTPSTVKTSEKALGRKPKRKADNESKRANDTRRSDVRDRDDINPSETIDRFYRELEKVDSQIGYYKAKKRQLLQAILAEREKLANPSKALVKASDEELQARFEGPNVKEKRVAKEDSKEEGVLSETEPAAEAKPDVD